MKNINMLIVTQKKNIEWCFLNTPITPVYL